MPQLTLQGRTATSDAIQILPGYLGNKSKVIEQIRHLAYALADGNKTFLDLFGGSGVVGYSLKKDFQIYSNDIQKFSYLINKVLIEPIPTETLVRVSEKRVFNEHFNRNLSRLATMFSDALKKERDIIGKKDIIEFRLFSAGTPNYAHHRKTISNEFANSREAFSESHIEAFKKNPRKTPYSLFTLYFMNSYFGVEQCMEIDSIRYAIDKISNSPIDEDYEKQIYIACLIYSLNSVVSSVGGHFAQPQRLNGDESVLKLIRRHSASIRTVFIQKLHEIKKKLTNANPGNKVFNVDYRELFNEHRFPQIQKVGVIYADPPYTIDHYSRFYHVLETVVNYDYPESIGIGRYRLDRIQSNFCIKSKVEHEFDTMLRLMSKTRAKIIISYTDTYRALMSSEQIQTACKKHYRIVKLVQRIKYDYSSLGQNSTNGGNELLFVCKEPRQGI